MKLRFSPLPVLLTVFAVWGVLLSVESWFRSPGVLLGPRLPPMQLKLQNGSYKRSRPPLHYRSVRDLPSAAKLIRHWVVVYKRAGAEAEPITLVAFEGTGSGRANRLPVKRLKEWLMEDDLEGEGGCLVRRPTGEATILSTDEAWDAMYAARDRNPVRTTLPWLLGLRSIEDVHCLWLITDANPSQTKLEDLAAALLGPPP